MSKLYHQAELYANKIGSRNPFLLLEFISAICRISYEFEATGLKGFAAIVNNIPYCVINGKLNEYEQRIIAGHEAAHLILHKNEILNSKACVIKDFNLYDNSGKLEFEANSFLANFLISDEDVLKTAIDPDEDYFTIANKLYMLPQLLAFKLYSMKQRGIAINNPSSLNSKFLKK